MKQIPFCALASLFIVIMLTSCGSSTSYTLQGNINASQSGQYTIKVNDFKSFELKAGDGFSVSLPEYDEYNIAVLSSIDTEVCLVTPDRGVITQDMTIQISCVALPEELASSLKEMQEGLVSQQQIAHFARQMNQTLVSAQAQASVAVGQLSTGFQEVVASPGLPELLGQMYALEARIQPAALSAPSVAIGARMVMSRPGLLLLLRCIGQWALSALSGAVSGVSSTALGAIALGAAKIVGLITLVYGLLFIVTRILSREALWAFETLITPALEAFDISLSEELSEALDEVKENERYQRGICMYHALGGPDIDTSGLGEAVENLFLSWSPEEAFTDISEWGWDVITEFGGYLYDSAVREWNSYWTGVEAEASSYWGALTSEDSRLMYLWDMLMNIDKVDLEALLTEGADAGNELLRAMLQKIREVTENPDEVYEQFIQEAHTFQVGAIVQLEAAVEEGGTICGLVSYEDTVYSRNNSGYRAVMSGDEVHINEAIVRDYVDSFPGFLPVRRQKLEIALFDSSIHTEVVVPLFPDQEDEIVIETMTNDRGYFFVDIPEGVSDLVYEIRIDLEVDSASLKSLPEDSLITNCSSRTNWSFAYINKPESQKVYSLTFRAEDVKTFFDQGVYEYNSSIEDQRPLRFERRGTAINVPIVNPFVTGFSVLDMAMRVAEWFCQFDAELNIPSIWYSDKSMGSRIDYGYPYLYLISIQGSKFEHVLNSAYDRESIVSDILLSMELLYHSRLDAQDSLYRLPGFLPNLTTDAHNMVSANNAFTAAWIWFQKMMIFDDSHAAINGYDILGQVPVAWLQENSVYNPILLLRAFWALKEAYGAGFLWNVRSSDVFGKTNAFQTGFSFLGYALHLIQQEGVVSGSGAGQFEQILDSYLGLPTHIFQCPNIVTLGGQVCREYNSNLPAVDAFDFHNGVGRAVDPVNPRAWAMYNLIELFDLEKTDHNQYERKFLEYNFINFTDQKSSNYGSVQKNRYFVVSAGRIGEHIIHDNLIGIRGFVSADALEPAIENPRFGTIGGDTFILTMLKKGRRFSFQQNAVWGNQYGLLGSAMSSLPLLLPFPQNNLSPDDVIILSLSSITSKPVQCFWFSDEDYLSRELGWILEYEQRSCGNVRSNPNPTPSEWVNWE